jgi:hypothetical protein
MTTIPYPEKIYGRFDAAGKSTGFWTSDIYPPQEDGTRNATIPADAVEITFEVWDTLLDNPLTARYVNGQITLVEAPPIPPETPNPAMVEAQRANERLDAGVVAALDVAIAVKTAMQNIPDNFTAANFVASKIQLDALTEAVVAMLEGQAALPDMPGIKPPGKPP